jgi:hypothetical protein
MGAKLTHQQFLERASNIHGNKYSYPEEYRGANIKIKIECPIHGYFEQTPHTHIDCKCGCQNCGEEARRTKRSMTFDEFVVLANKTHNSKYEYFGTYYNAHTMIDIKCPIHGSFNQTPDKHLYGQHGCPKCGIGANVSKAEMMWLKSIGVPENYHQKTIKIGNVKVKTDAFDPNTNTIYEFYGDYWHGNPTRFNHSDINKAAHKTFGELYQKTMDRENLIKQASYNIVSIWESDWKRTAK